MGAYSSWPTMAITHHAIVRYAKALAYSLLGDDIVIVGKKAAERYLHTITEVLGMSVTLHKSVLPPERKGITAAEFARRIFINGNEVTPLPMKLLIQGVKHPVLMALLVKWCRDK